MLCEVVRRFAIRRALLDKVNERSLHAVPTVRLGGVAIVLATIATCLVGWTALSATLRMMVGGCAVLALVGLRDDIKPVSAALRMGIQLVLAIGFLVLVGVPPFLVAREVALPLPSLATGALLVVWIVGVLNIFNFMDGMDGLAGSQTVSVCVTLTIVLGASPLVPFPVVLGAAALGFLAHNFPPARMFMGDAGSTFIGMALAALAVLAMRDGVPITESALPLAPFLLDGTFTILRRARRGERVWEAHRTHLYQRAVQAGLGHRDVLLVYIGWMGVCGATTIAASYIRWAVVAGWGVALLGLFIVWQWVVRLESEKARAA